MEQVAEPYIRRKAMRHLQKGRVVIFGGGTEFLFVGAASWDCPTNMQCLSVFLMYNGITI